MVGTGEGGAQGLRLLWPRRDQAWLAGLAAGTQGVDPARLQVLLAEAWAQGARVVRTVVPAADDGRVPAAAGLRPGPGWLTLAAADPAPLAAFTTTGPDLAADGPRPRPRRLSGGPWHNPRVRLAVQAAVERALPGRAPVAARTPAPAPASDPLADPTAPYGLIPAGEDVFPLAGWGPFDLIDAMDRGEVVTAGDPAQPAGVMLLHEAAAAPGGRRVLIRFLGGAGPAAASLLAFAATRAGALPACGLAASLPLAGNGELLARLDGFPGVSLQRWRVYAGHPATS